MRYLLKNFFNETYLDIATATYFLGMHWEANHLNITESSSCSKNFIPVAHRLIGVANLIASSI